MLASFSFPKFRLFTIFSAAFLVGIVVASFLKIDFIYSREILFYAVSVLVLVTILNFLYKNILLVVISIIFLMIFLGLSYRSFFEYTITPQLHFDEKISIQGKIVSNPEVDFDTQKAMVKVFSSENRGARILVTLPHFPVYRYGDAISFDGVVRKPGIIDGFDYGNYLKKSLVFGIAKAENVKTIDQELTAKDKLFRGLYSISSSFESSINRILPEPHASLAAGLILGIKRNIPEYFSEALSKTGLTHIVALSGYNITIILIVISNLLLGHLNRKQVFIIGSMLALSFVLLTGAASSVVRAAIFSLMVIFGRTVGRQADFTNIILIAALLMLLFNPFLLRSDVGFQLSFLAFAGIIYISPFLQKIFDMKKYEKIPEFIKNPLAETLSAQILVTPLILTTFGRVSLISPVANVLVLWSIPLSMGLAFLSGFAGIVFYPLGKIFAYLLWPCLEFIIKTVTSLARLPFSSISMEGNLWLVGPVMYLIIIIYFSWLKRKLNIKLL